MSVPLPPDPLHPQDFAGVWHVVGTSLPMWKTRKNPTITYTPLPDGTVLDTVMFGPHQHSTLILGVDREDPQAPAGFVWQGLAPVSKWVTSRWRFVLFHPQEGWAVTHFTRTLFTPAGMDVCSRTPHMPQTQLQAILQLVERHPLCAPLVRQVFQPVHD